MNADASARVSADVRLGAPLAWTGALILGSFAAAAVLACSVASLSATAPSWLLDPLGRDPAFGSGRPRPSRT